ncbi:MAG: hypothetical protein JXP34_12890 [Planctomycetes bacterium]|nr:hypothetical protein [Planctomycetota bacterium]
MTRFAILLAVLVAAGAPDPAAEPRDPAARRVEFRHGGVRIAADRIEARVDAHGTCTIALGADAGRSIDVEAEVQGLPPGLRLAANALALTRRMQTPEGSNTAPREIFEATGRMRWRSETFSLACDRITLDPAGRRAELDGVRDVKVDLGGKHDFPRISLSTDSLAMDVEADVDPPVEVVLANADRFRAVVNGARIRLRRLTLRFAR